MSRPPKGQPDGSDRLPSHEKRLPAEDLAEMLKPFGETQRESMTGVRSMSWPQNAERS